MIVRPQKGESPSQLISRFLNGSRDIVREYRMKQYHVKNNKKRELKRELARLSGRP